MATPEMPPGEWREIPGPDGLALTVKIGRDRYGRAVVTGLHLEGRPIRADDLRRIPIGEIEASAGRAGIREDVDKLPPFQRTPGMEAEEFSRLVAEHYKVWSRWVPHPAAAMAEEHGVKPATMHTWIREARLRGFLPPARRGKGGADDA